MKIALHLASREAPEVGSHTRPSSDRTIREDELIDILENRELGGVADRAGLPMRAFGADQAGDQRRTPNIMQ